MTWTIDLGTMDAKIKAIRTAARELKEMAGEFEAVKKNADRILASVRMLEINVSDFVELEKGEAGVPSPRFASEAPSPPGRGQWR